MDSIENTLKLPGSALEIRSNGDGQKVYEFVISDETLDRHGAVIKASAWDLSNYTMNGIFCYNHLWGSENPDNILGSATAEVVDGKLIGKAVFQKSENNQLAGKIQSKVDEGVLKATSVGFIPIDWSMGDAEKGENPDVVYFRKVDLIEFSIVDIPSNPKAIRKSLEKFITTKKEIAHSDETAPRINQLNKNKSQLCLN